MRVAEINRTGQHCLQLKGWIRLAQVGLGVLLTVALHLLPVAYGQLPFPQEDTSKVPQGVTRSGLLEVTEVSLDGQPLFEIAAPTVSDRSAPGGQVPVEVRAEQIEANLNQLLAPKPSQVAGETAVLNPETLEIYIETINNQPVLLAQAAELNQPQALVTVTEADAQYHGIPKPQLAQEWQAILQRSLTTALAGRQPAAQKRRLQIATGIALGMILMTIILAALWTWLGGRRTQLENQHQQVSQQHPYRDDGNERDWLNWFEGLKDLLSLQRQIKMISLLRWLLFWGMAFVWLGGIAAILYRFPSTRQVAIGLVSTPALALAAWFLAGLLNRVADLGLDRFAKAWQMNETVPVEALQRRALRISTITNVLKGFKGVLIYAIALILVLQILEIAPISVLALGAIFALAVSFAAQSLVKDVVNGFLIVLEDQYAIGDYVAINGVMGMVENLNLRITQIRSNEGNLITIPNSQILQAENMSRQWARCDYTVEVAYDTDVDEAIALIQSVAETLAADPEWGPLILDPTEILGVDHISHAGIKIRIWIRTLPLKQWSLAREFRRRLKIAFDHHGIHMGIPQQTIWGYLNQPDINDLN